MREYLADIFSNSLYYLGFYKHDFFLLITITGIKSDFLSNKTLIEATTGMYCSPFEDIGTSNEKKLTKLNSRASLTVKSEDSEIVIIIYKLCEGLKFELSRLSLNVNTEIIDANFPQNKCYELHDGEKRVGKIRLSFTKLDKPINIMNEIVCEQAKAWAMYYNSLNPKILVPVRINPFIDTQLPHEVIYNAEERIAFMALALEGPITIIYGDRKVDRHSKAIFREGRFFWAFWHSKKDFIDNKRPESKIDLINIDDIAISRSGETLIIIKNKIDGQRICIDAKDIDLNKMMTKLKVFVKTAKAFDYEKYKFRTLPLAFRKLLSGKSNYQEDSNW